MGVLSVIKDYGTELLNAIRDNDLKTFRLICEKHLRYDAKIAELCVMDIKHRPTQRFACPLILATRLDDPSIIRYMLEIGVNPNFVHHTAYTTKRKELLTPLHVAVELGLYRTVELLMRYNADPNVPDHNEDTPFIMAVKKADWVVMKMLLTSGANTLIPDRLGSAPIHTATLYGHLQMVKSLMKQGADIHQKGHLGTIPSHIAAKEGHVHLVQVFCSSDPALINTKIPCYEDKREKAPIHLACENGHAETVIALLDQFGADINLIDSAGNTPLHCLVLHNYQHLKMRDKDYFYATAKILVRYKARTNERNREGYTPLHLAAAHNHPKIVELLLNIGANPMTESNDRQKAIDLVPDSDAVSKQLLKDHMLNPRPAMNVSSLSLIQNSSFHVGIPKFEHSSRNNTAKNSPMMARSYNDQSLKRLKPQNCSMSSSSSSVFIKDPKKHSYFAPRMRSELMRPIDENDMHHHLPPMGHFPSTLEQSSKSLKNLKKKKHLDSSIDTSTLTGSLYNVGRHRKHRYSSDDSSTLNYEKHKRVGHRRHRSSDARHHKKDRRRKGSYSYYKEDSDSTIRNRKSSKAKQDYFSSDEGIRITTVEGKPKTIEVEYEKGPITIEFENDDEVFQHEKDEKRNKKKHRKSGKHDRLSKRVESRSDNDHKNEDIQEWYEEMKAKKKRMKKRNQKSESEEESDNSGPYEQVQEVDSQQFEERRRKRKEKSNRQRQYEEQLAIERTPIEDPEPPIENFESRSEADSESVESEELEDDIKETQRLLNESATRRISEVMEGVKARWSTDEFESDSNDQNNMSENNNKSFINKDKLTVAENVNNKDLSYSKEKVDDSKLNFSKNKASQDYSTPLIEISPYQTIKLETILLTGNDNPLKNNANVRKPIQQVSVEKETTFDVERKGSLNLRVSENTPKAYTRAEKDSARSDFILAHPARIESSSEASDSEAGTSSLKRREEWRKPSPPVFPGPPKMPITSKTKEKFESNKNDPHFLKPYKSIGKIEAQTNLLDEAMNVETTTTKTIKTISESKTKIIPEKYQINKNKIDQKNQSQKDKANEWENSESDDEIGNHKYSENRKKDKENKNGKKINANGSKKKTSLDSLLEDYDEEPTMGMKKNQSAIIIDLAEFKKEVEKEYLENQELENNNAGKYVENKDLNRSDDILLKKSKKNEFDFAQSSSLNNSMDHTRIANNSLKSNSKTIRTKTKTENLELSSDDDASNVESDSNIRDLKESSKSSKYKTGKTSNNLKSENEVEKYNRSNSRTKTSSTNNSQSLDFVGKDKNVKITDLNKLGLDIAIPSTNKDTDDTKVPYLKLDSKMYESFIGRRRIGIEEIKRNGDKEGRKSHKNSEGYSSKVYKPPKPQVSPIPHRKNIINSREKKSSRKGRKYSDDVEDLNYIGYRKKTPTFLPKQPNKPYDVHKMSGYSDTETQDYKYPRRRNKAHSEAELSDYEPPNRSNSEMSYKQLALNSLQYKMQRSRDKFVLPRPVAHNDKNLKHLLKGYRPRRRRRKRGDYTLPSAGWYGHYEMKRVISLQSFSGSEFDVDPDVSFISDEEWSSEDLSGSNLSLSRKNENPVYDSLMKFQKLNDIRVEMRDKENEPIASLEPDPVLLHKYDEIGRLWMEQVDRETVQKFKTMYLSVLPEGQNLPSSIYSPQPDDCSKIPQWVVAKSRVRNHARVLKTSSEPQDEIEGVDDVSADKGHVIFFKVGQNWIELAWVLFERLQDDSQTVRMIKDIQLKHPDNLPEQIVDLMNRWWSIKGDKATIEELKRSLELAQMFYIGEDVTLREDCQEEVVGFAEDQLETGVVKMGDHDVNTINQKYTDKSLNGTFVAEKGGKTYADLSAEDVLRKVQSSKKVPAGMNERMAKKQQSKGEANSSMEDSSHHRIAKQQPGETTFSASENDNVIFLKKKRKKPIKHETNL